MKRRSSTKGTRVLDLVDADPGPSAAGVAPEGLDSFETFYRHELPHLLVLARALVGAAYADDVAQDSLLVAYRTWDRVRALASPAGYVRGICAHKAASHVRRRAIERRVLGRLSPAATSTFDELPEESERFWSEVRRLPARQAQVVALHYALDLSVLEVANVLDCAEGTVKAHLHRARATLSGRLGITEEES